MLEAVLETPFFKDLTREQFDLLAPLFESFTAPARTAILEEGQGADYLYLLLSGTVALRYKPYDGPKITITHLHEGDVFGWSSVIGGETYTSDVNSTTDIEALRIRGSDLRQFCMERPEIGGAILEKLANVVAPRWKNARKQIRQMLKNKVSKA